MGATGFAAAQEAGRSLSLEDALAQAEASAAGRAEITEPEGSADGAGGARPFGLTPRELEVMRQLAEGRSDREIADALFISHGTARQHVANILGKLGVGSRTAAAVAIREHLA